MLTLACHTGKYNLLKPLYNILRIGGIQSAFAYTLEKVIVAASIGTATVTGANFDYMGYAMLAGFISSVGTVGLIEAWKPSGEA